MPETTDAKAPFPAGSPATLSHKASAPPAQAGLAMRVWHFLWVHHWFVLVAGVVAALGTWQAARIIVGPAVVVDVVRRGLLVETVVATGSVQTPFRVSVGSQITGTVTRVLVDEGQRVTQGQGLIELDGRELTAAVGQAQGVVDQADARMRQLQELTLPMARETLKEAEATATNAQQTFDRASKLALSGFETRVALDAAKKGVDVAHTQVRIAELQVYTAAVGGSDFVMAQTQLAQAKSSLATAVSRLGYSMISAPRAGVLITRNVEQGMVDTKSADSVFDLMREVNRESGTSFLMVTHNLELAKRCDRIVNVIDGRIDA